MRGHRHARPIREARLANAELTGATSTGNIKAVAPFHFGRDRYRLIWEVDDDFERVSVLRVDERGAQGTSIYSLPRPEARRRRRDRALSSGRPVT